ncbi:centromere protein X isoform X3 [Aotus nancymaae]|uniref:centromere protein X isoform X3 n=1 Tax=Aotus nancymaae TaxID=37293 RepID=UPI0030FEF8A2
MEGAGAGAGFRKELVSRLLHVHFKDDKTKVSGDALQLMAELLKIFVVGEPRARCPGFLLFFQRENQDTFSRFPQGPELGLLSLLVRCYGLVLGGGTGPGLRSPSIPHF